MNLIGDLRRLEPGVVPWGGRRWAAVGACHSDDGRGLPWITPGRITFYCFVLYSYRYYIQRLILYMQYFCHMIDASTLSFLRISK